MTWGAISGEPAHFSPAVLESFARRISHQEALLRRAQNAAIDLYGAGLRDLLVEVGLNDSREGLPELAGYTYASPD